MKREIVQPKDFIEEYLHYSEYENYNLIEEEQISFDGEKGFVELELIYQRKSDLKYFKLKYSDWGKGENDLGKNPMIEVFPKKVEKIIFI